MKVLIKGCVLSPSEVYSIYDIFRAFFSRKHLEPEIIAKIQWVQFGHLSFIQLQQQQSFCVFYDRQSDLFAESACYCVLWAYYFLAPVLVTDSQIRVTHLPCHVALLMETMRWQHKPRHQVVGSYTGRFFTSSPVFPLSFICVSVWPLTLVLAKSNYPQWKNNTIINNGAVE